MSFLRVSHSARAKNKPCPVPRSRTFQRRVWASSMVDAGRSVAAVAVETQVSGSTGTRQRCGILRPSGTAQKRDLEKMWRLDEVGEMVINDGFTGVFEVTLET